MLTLSALSAHHAVSLVVSDYDADTLSALTIARIDAATGAETVLSTGSATATFTPAAPGGVWRFVARQGSESATADVLDLTRRDDELARGLLLRAQKPASVPFRAVLPLWVVRREALADFTEGNYASAHQQASRALLPPA